MKPVSDQKQREEALNISKSYVVQAPAGSGKTELLTQRILKLLSYSETPESILAITFTRKAASEMKTRIINSLERAETLKTHYSSSDLNDYLKSLNAHESSNLLLAIKAMEQSHKLNWNLLENPNRLQIKTIDSFCAQLAFQLPLLSEIGGASQIHENPDEIFLEASRNFIASLEEEQAWTPALTRVLSYLDKRTEQLELIFSNLLHKRLQWAPIIAKFRDRTQEESVNIIKEELEYCVKDIVIHHIKLITEHPFYPLLKSEVNALQDFITDNLSDDKALKHLKPLSDSYGNPTKECIENIKRVKNLLLTKENTVRARIDKTIGFPADKKEPFTSSKARMKNLLEAFHGHPGLIELLANIDTLPPLEISQEDIQISSDICECLYYLLAYLQVSFQNHQALDFSEVQLKALYVLNPDTNGTSSATNTLLSLNSSIQHILVDEYQDTSIVQLQLLKYLTSDWHYEDDSKTLFLVGDPMQSIYRFREAEVAIFLEAQERGLDQIQLNKLTLSCNFRSGKDLVKWANEHFTPSFPQHSDIQNGAVTYSASEAFQSQMPSEVHCRIERIAPDQEESADLQDINICDEIIKIKQSKPEETIAVLIQARTHIHNLIAQFKRLDIPYHAIDIDILTEKPYVNTLFNLSSVLINTFDDMAWFGLCRSTILGLENDSLLKLGDYTLEAQVGIGEMFIHKDEGLLDDFILKKDMTSAEQNALLRFYHVIKSAHSHIHTVNISSAIEFAWLALGGPATVSQNELEDCERYFELLRTLESKTDKLTSSHIKGHLEKLYAKQVTEHNNPVQIMTIHKSKGLEFDHVFLPKLHKKGNTDKGNLLNWDTHHASNEKDYLLLAPQIPTHKKKSVETNTLYQFLGEHNKQKAKNESIRLLYVACTRAKQKLFLYASINQKIDKNEVVDQNPPSGSLLALIYPYLTKENIEYLNPDNLEHPVENLEETPYQLKRIAHNWNNLTSLRYSETETRETANPDNHINSIFHFTNQEKNEIYYSTLGTLVHFGLQNLVERSEQDTIDRIKDNDEYINLAKSAALFSQDQLENLLNECETILLRVAQPHEDDWIFDNSLSQSQCEMNLMYLDQDGRLKQSYVDRTFIKNGTRWIIDYKNSQPKEAQSLEQFFEHEKQNYLGQLKHYSALFKKIEEHPQQLALYFPRLCKLHCINQ